MTTTTSCTSPFQLITSSLQEKWREAESLFCGCASAIDPLETYTPTYEETDEHHHHPFYYNFETGSTKQVIIVWEKLDKSQSQSSHIAASTCCQSQNNTPSCQAAQPTQQNDSEIFSRELRSNQSVTEETCTTASMNTMSFDEWDDEDEDDEDDSGVALNKIPDLTLSTRVFSNETGCTFSFYSSPALAHDEEEDDVNSLTSGEDEVEVSTLRI